MYTHIYYTDTYIHTHIHIHTFIQNGSSEGIESGKDFNEWSRSGGERVMVIQRTRREMSVCKGELGWS